MRTRRTLLVAAVAGANLLMAVGAPAHGAPAPQIVDGANDANGVATVHGGASVPTPGASDASRDIRSVRLETLRVRRRATAIRVTYAVEGVPDRTQSYQVNFELDGPCWGFFELGQDPSGHGPWLRHVCPAGATGNTIWEARAVAARTVGRAIVVDFSLDRLPRGILVGTPMTRLSADTYRRMGDPAGARDLTIDHGGPGTSEYVVGA